MQIRDILSLLNEADVVDFDAAKSDRTKKKVGALVSGFQQYLDHLESIKAEFGRHELMLRQYLQNPTPSEVPGFLVEVHFDHVAKAPETKPLVRLGFEVFKPSPDWGTPIHDTEQDRSWSHGDYLLPGKTTRERNWYPQTSAEKQISPEEAVELFAKRAAPEVKQQLGLYQPLDIHYHKGVLQGDPKRGWDIRTHPDHASHYEGGKSFRILFQSQQYSEDAEIRTEEDLTEALRVYKAIQRAEKIRLSGASNVVDLTQR